MSTITKQAVQAVADLKAGYTLGHADVAILNELARIALASLEAEAVGEVVLGEFDDCGCHPDARVECIAADGQAGWENFKDGTRLYTAPTAPVSVPAAMEMDDDFDSAFEHGKAVGWNAYRAAMLQGANGNAPAHFRSRPAQSSLSPAQGGNSPVIPEGWVMVPIEPTADMREAYHQAQAEYEDVDGLWSPDHQWQAMLAAAPKQEAK